MFLSTLGGSRIADRVPQIERQTLRIGAKSERKRSTILPSILQRQVSDRLGVFHVARSGGAEKPDFERPLLAFTVQSE
jgi:hypothetical protein